MSAKAYCKKTAAFAGFLIQNIPATITDEVMDGWMANPEATKKFLSGLMPPATPVVFDTAPWSAFYAKHFGITADLSGLQVPPKPDYACRAIVILPGITNNQAFDACTKAFKTWRYYRDLDTVRDIVKRPNGPYYVVWVRDTVEADEEMQNKSANDVEAAGINTLTLKERLILGLAYFDETGRHLDINNWTLCAGSRFSDGSVPYVSWRDGRLDVSWAGVDARYSDLRARVAVS